VAKPDGNYLNIECQVTRQELWRNTNRWFYWE